MSSCRCRARRPVLRRARRGRANSGGSFGVDLNRNYPLAFEPAKRHSTAPLDQPESILLAAQLEALQPDLIIMAHFKNGGNHGNIPPQFHQQKCAVNTLLVPIGYPGCPHRHGVPHRPHTRFPPPPFLHVRKVVASLPGVRPPCKRMLCWLFST